MVESIADTTNVAAVRRFFEAALNDGRLDVVDEICGADAELHAPFACLDNPEAFDPERFTPEARRARHRYAYIPFGGGPRGCIGFPFAMIEMPLVLARVLQRYRLTLVPGHPSGVPESAISLRQRHGALMRVELPSAPVGG